MTSESDSTPRRRPPTIDLTATEIGTERPAAEAGLEASDPEESHLGDSAAPSGDGSDEPRQRAAWELARPHATGAAVGALAMAVILVGLWLAGVVPMTNGSPGGTNSSASGISAQLDKIQAELQAQPPPQALASRLTAVEAQTKALSDSLAALSRRIDDIAVEAKASVQHGDLDALTGRIAALEDNVKALSDSVAHRSASADDRAARAAVAAEALRAVVERGAPYPAELAAVKALGADQNAVTALEPFAAAGLPSTTELAHELSQLTPALLQASGAASSGGSFIQRLESSAKSLVRVTPIDAPPSNEPLAIVAKLNADAERADIADAVAEIARLPQSAQTVAEPWVQKVNARNAAIAASRRIAADALTALSNANTQ
jgi:hypothetical protein